VLAKGIARDLDDLIAQEKLDGEMVVAEPLGMEAFAHWVQKLSVVLLVVGLAGAYLEMNTPGFGLPGFVSVAAFSVFFFGNYLAGNLAGYEMAVLFVIGLVLIGIEIFLVPGTFIAGFIGAALVMGSLALSMVDRVDLEWKWSGLPGTETWLGLLEGSLYTLLAALGGAFVVTLLGLQFFPKTPMGRRLILAEVVPSGASIPGNAEAKDESWKSWRGRSTTDLRPSGKAVFEGRLLDVITEGEFVERDRPLRIRKREGSRIVVEEAGDESGGT
jgi:membrane-bound serine protease (ClpP class)